MDIGSLGLAAITIVGVALLAVILLWAMLRNRSAGGREHTEEATRELYRQEDAARDPMDDGIV